MANIAFKDLIGSLAGAVIEAQDQIERHQVSNLKQYFNKNDRPESITLRMPSIDPSSPKDSEDLYRVPILPLVSPNPLAITDVELSFDVDIGDWYEEPDTKATPPASSSQTDAGVSRIGVNIAGSKASKAGSIHVIMRVANAEPSEGTARLINHLTQTQGVIRTVKNT